MSIGHRWSIVDFSPAGTGWGVHPVERARRISRRATNLKDIIMSKRAILKKIVAAAALCASAVGGVGAIGLVAAGTANAMPDQCARIQQSWDTALDMYDAAYAQGDYAGADSYLDIALAAQRNYRRVCQ
jgi:hypothetical protein